MLSQNLFFILYMMLMFKVFHLFVKSDEEKNFLFTSIKFQGTNLKCYFKTCMFRWPGGVRCCDCPWKWKNMDSYLWFKWKYPWSRKSALGGNKNGNARTPLTVCTSLRCGKYFRGVARGIKLWMNEVGNVLKRICFKHHEKWLVETCLKSFKSSIKSSQKKTHEIPPETFVWNLTFRIEDRIIDWLFFIWYSWYIVNTFLSGGIEENFINTQRYYTYETF